MFYMIIFLTKLLMNINEYLKEHYKLGIITFKTGLSAIINLMVRMTQSTSNLATEVLPILSFI